MIRQCKATVCRRALPGLCAVGLMWAGVAESATIQLKDGRTVDGGELRVNANGDYVLTTASGQRTYRAAQVTEASADRPAAYDRAVQLAKAGQYDEAVVLLLQIAERYRKLGWDDRARYDAARIHARQGQYEEALGQLTLLSPRFRSRPEVRLAHAQAQLETGAYDQAEKELDDVIRKGGRNEAARAQVLRGDLKRKRRQLEPAVLDYLRTVVLFEAVKEVQPEALYKAAETLEELRDARAKDLFARLESDYADSEYAARARAR